MPAPPTRRAHSATLRPSIVWATPESRLTPLRVGDTWGRDRSASFVLSGDEVSRNHVVIEGTGLAPVLRDLDSRNGTFVGGERITSRALAQGDVVRVGEWVGVVVDAGEGESPTPHLIAEGWLGGAKLDEAIAPARTAAPTRLPIVIEGETGSGKEGLAHAIHDWSGRGGPFIAVNCASLPSAMAEAELFGYRRGAFTGAERAHLGFFRAAHGGTLFLDELLELPLPLQAKLLRALESHEVQPLGESRPERVDVRVVCASQVPLAQAVEAGRIRADLKSRVSGLTAILPPLRDRREDIVGLFKHALASVSAAPTLSSRFVQALLLYNWPLNVRELVQCARQLAAVYAGEKRLEVWHLPAELRQPSSAQKDAIAGATSSTTASSSRLATNDADALLAFQSALEASGNNVTKAALSLGISRARAYRLIDSLRKSAGPSSSRLTTPGDED
jgi:DNA-binding NtrC family response regulator